MVAMVLTSTIYSSVPSLQIPRRTIPSPSRERSLLPNIRFSLKPKSDFQATFTNSCNFGFRSTLRVHPVGKTVTVPRRVVVSNSSSDEPRSEESNGCGGCRICRMLALRRRIIVDSVVSSTLIPFSFMVSENQSAYASTKELLAEPSWYQKFFANIMANSMQKYEDEVENYKRKLFASMCDSASEKWDIMELGIGSGPNLKYYANAPFADVNITGVDPNAAMEKFARASAVKAGVDESRFTFVQALGENLPLPDSSMDVVISTLVLCSVQDVNATLKEVQRILRSGGKFVFLEHVAAKDGTTTHFFQRVLDPVQQFLADGCHLTRNPIPQIQSIGFKTLNYDSIDVPGLSLLSPHVVGYACKA